MRVRLRGPKENRFAVGAIVRLVFGDRKGPAREVHAGSGYGSQDSLVPLLGMPRPATEVEVSWPGGRIRRVRIPEGAGEVDVILAGAATGVLE